MKRFIIALAFAFPAIGLYGVARADCGAHQFAARVSELRAVEAMPLTLTNVYGPPTSFWSFAPREKAVHGAASAPLVGCPEDTAYNVQTSLSILQNLWLNALRLQNALAVYRFAKGGKISDPAPCIALYFAQLRAGFLETWLTETTSFTTPRFQVSSPALGPLLRNPYFPHVKSLWLGLAQQVGLRLPPPGKNTDDQVSVLKNAAQIQFAHLPEGIQCKSLP
ncbi:MAG TPA: hypothetical protein VFO29_11825 [Candidatus Rubrimentiphilum sp.]|nr:hypothetical protein [Candidatus Rubrimentiphilum sp.]